MSKTVLQIAPNLRLPLDAVTQTFAVMAIRGVGKTHTATVLAEEMLKAGQPVCVYDPTGAWYGLKSSADGKKAGFEVVVFGGEHADVPLEESAGETIARVIVERRIPAVLDTSLMRKGSRVRFMTDFAETLYRLNREPLHLILDEAQTIAPQKPFPEVTRLLGAMEDIVLQGRRRGLGATIISQRPALVNKNVLTQCSVLVAMRIIGPQDRAAIEDWIEAHGDKEKAREVLASLPALEIGEGWVWSPGWLRTLVRVKFRQRETFDSSATPEVGKRAARPTAVAEIDLAALGDEIRQTVERTKADDPRELRKKIAELERQLSRAPQQVEKIVEVPVLKNGQLDRTEKIMDRSAEIVSSLTGELAELRRLIAPAATAPMAAQKCDQDIRRRIPEPPLPPRAASAGSIATPPSGRAELNPSELAVLDAAASFPSGATRQRIAVFSGRSIKSSSFQSAFPSLQANRLIYAVGNRYEPTEAGLALAVPNAGVDLADWLSKLTPSEAKVLRCIADAFPDRLPRSTVAERTGQSPLSSSFQSAFPALRDLELIEGRDDFRASEVLMR